MKKHILIIGFVILFPALSIAQTLAGIHGNFSLLFADVTFTDDVGSQDFFENVATIGVSVSGSKKILPLSFADLHAGVGLDYYGWKAVDNASGKDVASYSAIYLDIAGVLKRNINDKFNVGAGLGFGVGVTGNQTITASGNEYAIFRDEALKRTNMNLILNGGYQFNESLGLFTEYRLGLINIEGKWNANDQQTTLGSFRLGVTKSF